MSRPASARAGFPDGGLTQRLTWYQELPAEVPASWLARYHELPRLTAPTPVSNRSDAATATALRRCLFMLQRSEIRTVDLERSTGLVDLSPVRRNSVSGKCCRHDAPRRVTTSSLSRPAAVRVAQLSHDLIWSQVDADRREAEHRLLPYHDVVEPEHVVPPRERAQVDGAVDLEPEAVEIHVEVPLPSLTVEPNHLTPRRRYLCATGETSKVNLVQRVGAALDVAA